MAGVRERLLAFISSDKDVPLLAGFSMGLYLLLFYYAANYSLANSVVQFLALSLYYIIAPVAMLYILYRLVSITRFSKYKSHILFVAVCLLFSYYVLEIIYISFSKKKIFVVVTLVSILLSVKFSRYYKLFIILFFFSSVFNVFKIGTIIWQISTASATWQKLPDSIEHIEFKSHPNIYYIQPDGYTNPENLKGATYNFDNTAFEGFLRDSGFKVYNDFRSNYYSTLLSNASIFAMKHHYVQQDIDPYTARNAIITDNAVLRILKNNKYKTHFITQRPYLVINRPAMGYDFCNFEYSSLPYFMDGWDTTRDVYKDMETQVLKNSKEGNFYFIEKIAPGHITGNEPFSKGVEGERKAYLEAVKEANDWLRQTVNFINKNDPSALVIIGADHGGFVGLEYLGQTEMLITEGQIKKSMFGALMAIKWNNAEYGVYDGGLKTSVNMFRTVFSFLAKDTSYLKDMESDDSFMRTLHPQSVYKYIDGNGDPSQVKL